MKIANKIGLSFLFTAVVLTGTAVPYFYLIARDALQKSIYDKLEEAATSRSDHIETYLKMLEISVGQLSKSTVLENFLKINDKEYPRQADAFAQAMRRLKRTKNVNPSIAEFLLMDKTGKVVVSSNESSVGIDKSSDSFFLGAGKELFIKDVYYSEDYKEPLMAVSAPLLDSQTGELLGVLAARARLNDLNNIVTEKTGMGNTGEIYIVNKYGYMLTPPRFKEDAALKQRANIQNSGERPVNIYPDYRGVQVLGVHEHIPKMKWVVLAEIDIKEVFAPLAKLRLVFIVILLTVPIVAWLLGIFLAKLITDSLHKLHKGIEIIGSGNLDYKVGTNAKDEVGQLSRAFDEMTANLKTSTTSIEHLNKEIAERKIIEKSLQESENRYRSLFVSSRDAIMTLEPPSWRFTSANPSTLEMFKAKSEEEFLSNEPWKLSPELQPDGRLSSEKAKEMIETAMREGFNSFEWVHKRISGEAFFAEVSLSRVELGGRVFLHAIVRDISERKKVAEALKESEGRFKAIFDHANDGIVMANVETRKFYTGNNMFCQMLGYSIDEIKNLGVTDIHPQEDLPYVMEQFDRQTRKEIAVAKDLPVKRKDGSIFYADVNSSLITLAGKTYILGLFRDITERKKAEGALAEAMKVKSDFTSTVSHELRTPLTAIKEGIALVLDGTTGAINAEQKEFLSLAKRNVDRLGRLINDVLDFQKLEAQKMVFNIQENDINESAREVYNTMAPLTDKKGLGLLLKLEEGLPRVKFDRDRIVQVLTNLVNNAIKFTEKGSIVIASSYKDDAIQVAVKDSGPGIKEEDMGRLFQQFRQLEKTTERKTGGTGLGLAISKEIIEKHKGRIWAESEFGEGTTFRFILPVKAKDKVLVIDDEKAMLAITKNFLEKEGYGVTCSEKGLEAIEIIGRDKPDLVILDMKLQDISGYEIIGRLRSNKETSKIPIIVMSGYPEELIKIEDRQEELALVSIAKPFDLESLLSIARRLLQQRL